MSQHLVETRAEERRCPDPDCGGLAEPEQDGDHKYFACVDCGFEFGWERVETSILAEDADGNCSVGVPASVRRAVSGIGQPQEPPVPKPVSLGLTIGRRPE